MPASNALAKNSSNKGHILNSSNKGHILTFLFYVKTTSDSSEFEKLLHHRTW